MSPTPVVPSPIVLYARLWHASVALIHAIDHLARQEPTLALPLEAAWQHLDDLLEQLPAALAQETHTPLDVLP